MDAVLRRVVPGLIALAVFAGAGKAHAASTATPTPSPTKGVVLVNTNLGLENGSAAGTGIVLTKTGEVLTNNHVISGATSIKVTVPATKRSYVADVIGYDMTDDVALLKLEGATNLATATIGNSAKVKVGQVTRAVGNANGGGKLVVTSGKVLALKQKISVQQDDGEVAPLAYLVETSAHLVPGDSGGPLIDKLGHVIGIDAAGSGNATVANPPGYAIAINHALTIVNQIASLRSSTLVHIGATAFMGIDVQTTSAGLVVADVIPGSPAESAGLQAGDVIASIDGTSVSSLSSLRAVLFQHHPGDGISVAYTDRFGGAGTAAVTLASGPPQ
jgi:S1-C subfamily serine protease